MSAEVELESVVVTLGASLVAASRFLRSAAREQSGLASAEAAGPPSSPAYVLAEASFDVVFSVTRVDEVASPDPPVVSARRDVKLADTERDSLLRGATEETKLELDELLAAYQQMKSLHAAARESPNRIRDIGIPAPSRLSPGALVELRNSATAAARRKLDRFLDDYEGAHADLLRTKEAISAGPRRLTFVRLDPEAVGAEGAPVQKARLVFRADMQETIEVDGRPISIPQ
jgi:hypothetical protein